MGHGAAWHEDAFVVVREESNAGLLINDRVLLAVIDETLAQRTCRLGAVDNGGAVFRIAEGRVLDGSQRLGASGTVQQREALEGLRRLFRRVLDLKNITVDGREQHLARAVFQITSEPQAVVPAFVLVDIPGIQTRIFRHKSLALEKADGLLFGQAVTVTVVGRRGDDCIKDGIDNQQCNQCQAGCHPAQWI